MQRLILDKDIKPIYGPEREGDVRESLADIGKAERLLGYRGRTAMIHVDDLVITGRQAGKASETE